MKVSDWVLIILGIALAFVDVALYIKAIQFMGG